MSDPINHAALPDVIAVLHAWWRDMSKYGRVTPGMEGALRRAATHLFAQPEPESAPRCDAPRCDAPGASGLFEAGKVTVLCPEHAAWVAELLPDHAERQRRHKHAAADDE